MRIQILSDLHIEHCSQMPNYPAAADLIVLAGDIASGTRGFSWARQQWPTQTIVYIAGNHEFYGRDYFVVLEAMRVAATEFSIHFLENDVLEIGGIRILGTSLWSDFALYGEGESAERAMRLAGAQINDFRLISFDGGLLEPVNAIALNRSARAFLREELAQPFAGKTVVATHWMPHPAAIHPVFAGDALSPYFCCDCRDIMADFSIDLWVFGHSHGSADFVDDSGCRVLANQRGYPHEDPALTGFDPALVVEV